MAARIMEDENAVESHLSNGPTEQSFRESFFTSGTDWSTLYEVDEYGMPVSPSENQQFDGSFSLTNSGYSLDCVSFEHFQTCESGTFQQALSSKRSLDPKYRDECYELSSLAKKLLSERPWSDKAGYLCLPTPANNSEQLKVKKNSPSTCVSKLVQSDLSSFLNLKPRANVDIPTAKRSRQQDIGQFFGIPPLINSPVVEGKFLSRFRPPELGKSKGSKSAGWQRSEEGKRKDAQETRRCPFYKKIPGTSFTVDAFRYGKVEGCTAYFLTHFHSDHYGGLSKGWCQGPIYCTPVTARLVVLCLYVDPRWICIMEIGKPLIINDVEVRMLEANHCPGAALIYFRFKNGQNILHTGDFRACKEMQNYPELINGGLSCLYLDTTYCNPRYRFPLQQNVIDFVIQRTLAALATNSKTLVVVGSYSIGKERVYVNLARALRVKVFADSRRRRVLSSLDWPELSASLSSDPSSTSLHVLPLSMLNFQRLKSYLNGVHPKYTAVLAFRPTGWTYSEKVGDQLGLLKPQVSGQIAIYGVPYSEHSSFTELREFVQFVRPAKVIPTVNNGKAEQRESMQACFSQWLRS